MNRGAAYEVLLAHLYSRLPTEALGNFEESLVNLYKHSLDFLVSALVVQEKNVLQRAFSALWTAQDVTSFSECCLQLENTLDIESRLVESHCNKEAAEKIETMLKASNYLEKAVTNTQSLIHDLRVQMKEEKENQEALDWVSGIPVLDHHINAKEGRTAETGQWVFKKHEFSQWERSQAPCLLWIHGIREFPDNRPSPPLF
jgi:hypothetical protein